MFTEKAPFETMQYLVKSQQLLTNGKLTYNENLYAVLELHLQTD